jgi:hypothetical protein
VLAAVDGERDLHALADTLGKSEFDVARTVFTLAAAGVIVLDDTRRGDNHEGCIYRGAIGALKRYRHRKQLRPHRRDQEPLISRIAIDFETNCHCAFSPF